MPVPLIPEQTWRDALRVASEPLLGMWVCSGNALVAEICAGSGLDWLLIDMEHAPNGLESVVAQLQAVAPYRVSSLVRVATGDTVTIKQVLDLGAQNLLVPMVDTPGQAEDVVSATRYPPRGVRGVGTALARASRWNRTPDYLAAADSYVSLTVQIESEIAVGNAAGIATTHGVDAVFIGPSDLAASLGLIGQQDHPQVRDAVLSVITAVKAAGKPVGVNAFNPDTARIYLDAGADFILVGADVALLARGSESLVSTFRSAIPPGPTNSY